MVWKTLSPAGFVRVWFISLHVRADACYVGETSQHFSTCTREHLAVDKASHIFKHLHNSERCRSLCTIDCFHILDHATTSFQLKIKEAIHIQTELPSLNQQSHHVNLQLSF